MKAKMPGEKNIVCRPCWEPQCSNAYAYRSLLGIPLDSNTCVNQLLNFKKHISQFCMVKEKQFSCDN